MTKINNPFTPLSLLIMIALSVFTDCHSNSDKKQKPPAETEVFH